MVCKSLRLGKNGVDLFCVLKYSQATLAQAEHCGNNQCNNHQGPYYNSRIKNRFWDALFFSAGRTGNF